MTQTTGDLDATPRAVGSSPPADRPDQASAPSSSVRWVVWLLTLAAIAFGLAIRLWYLFHVPVNSDEAIVGLMAQGILHGHFSAFYWGQPYGGAEPYVVAPLFAIFGESARVLACTPVLLWAISSVLVARVVRRLVATPGLALLAGALVWVGPTVALLNSTLEYGFRGVTLVCGLAIVLLALRLLEGSASWVDAAALGLFAGLGWWSSPEIAYFLFPAGLLVIAAVVRSGAPLGRWVGRVAAAAAAALLGALPWLWANVRSHLASLKTSSFPGAAITRQNTGFGGRLHVFFDRSLPIDLNLRRLVIGSPVFGGGGGTALTMAVLAVMAVAIVVCLLRRDRVSALAVGVVAFPFIYAAQPGTWYWEDGRYIIFLSPLLAIVAVAAIEPTACWLSGRWPGRPHFGGHLAVSFTVVALLVVGTMTWESYGRENEVSLSSFSAHWGDPNGPVDRAVGLLEAHGVRDGFADYWVAYKLDLQSRGELAITPAPGDIDRSTTLDAVVDRAPRQAWLFVPTPDLSLGYVQFSGTPVIVGPRAVTPTLFVAALDRLGIGHRTIRAGILMAVVPDRRVTIAQVLSAGG
jgi:hypothetical protein